MEQRNDRGSLACLKKCIRKIGIMNRCMALTEIGSVDFAQIVEISTDPILDQ